jgi:alanine racemase
LNNYDFFKKIVGNGQVWPVLKANAYGHGIGQVTKILLKRDFEYFVVDGYQEVLEIRKITNRPVLMIGTILPCNFLRIKWKNLAIMVQDKISIKELGKLNKRIKIHLKINTGMNRQGIEIVDLRSLIGEIKKYPKLELEGVFSHLANADDIDNASNLKQLDKFKRAVEVIENDFYVRYCHLAATAGVIKIQDPKINAIRLGIGLYGINNLDKKDKYYKKFANLKPVLRFKAVFTKISQIEKGDEVSYGGTFVADKKMNIGIIPVGYFEGLDRRLSNKGFVKYKNKFYPIIGRVCMNMAVVNLENTKAELFDEVEVVSTNPKDKNSIEKMAELAQMIPYELLVGINSSIRRVVK